MYFYPLGILAAGIGYEYSYSGEGENIGTRRGVVKLLELVVILLF